MAIIVKSSSTETLEKIERSEQRSFGSVGLKFEAKKYGAQGWWLDRHRRPWQRIRVEGFGKVTVFKGICTTLGIIV